MGLGRTEDPDGSTAMRSRARAQLDPPRPAANVKMLAKIIQNTNISHDTPNLRAPL